MHNPWGGGGGATTICPDATHPPSYVSKLAGGRGEVGTGVGGWRDGGWGGYWQLGGGVVPKGGGGAACDPLLPHAYLKWECVSGGMGV